MFPHCFLGHSVHSSINGTVPVSLSSGGWLGLDKLKNPEGSWDCEICLVQNKADDVKCVTCKSAKPGTNSEFKDEEFVKSLLVLPF